MEAVVEIKRGLMNVPLIRFPIFNGEWEHKKLSQFLSESKKRNLKLKFGKDDVLSVSGEFGIVNQIEHLGRSYAGVSVHNYHVVETGDIVYTKSPLKANPYGIIKLNKGKAGIVSTLYAVYNIKEGRGLGQFFDYYFSLDANVNRYLRPLVKKGAKNDMKVNNAYVLNDKIFVPALDEQKKIVSFLSSIDIKIQQLTKKKILLEKYKRGVMHQIFSQQLRFKDEGGQNFPKWKISKIGEIFSFKQGVQCSVENQYSEARDGLARFIRIVDLTNPDEPIRFISIEREENLLSEDDLFMVRYGTPGLVGYGYEGIIANNLFRLIPKVNTNNKFYYYVLKFLNNKITSLSSSTTMPALNFKSLEKLEIPIPTLSEQSIIANFLTSIDTKLILVTKQLEQAKQFKKGLLQQMFV